MSFGEESIEPGRPLGVSLRRRSQSAVGRIIGGQQRMGAFRLTCPRGEDGSQPAFHLQSCPTTSMLRSPDCRSKECNGESAVGQQHQSDDTAQRRLRS